MNITAPDLSYIDQLIRNCESAKRTKPVRSFIMSDIEDLKPIKSAIYIISQVSGEEPEDIFKKLKKFKEKQKQKIFQEQIKTPKLNSPSKVMYVGSSTTGLYKRIKQHIGDGYEGTYALHLKYWFNKEENQIMKNEYEIMIKEYDETVPREVIQLIEDSRSYDLKPAFGKLGGNSK